MTHHVLRADGFGVAFGEKVVLAELVFAVPASGITVLMGPSGTGKSTLLRSLAGLNQANSRYREWGSVLCQDRPLDQGRRPALVVQNPRALGTRVMDYLTQRCREAPQTGDRASAPADPRLQVEALLARAQAEDLRPWLAEQTIRLPTALQRCVAILGELATCPPLLLVDEPTATLDDADAERVMALLRCIAGQLPILVVLHNQRQARALGQHLVLMAGGRVQADMPLPAFFQSPPNPTSEQFVRTGSCCVASPDVPSAQLCDSAPVPPPLPPEAQIATAMAAQAELEQVRGLRRESDPGVTAPVLPVSSPQQDAAVRTTVAEPIRPTLQARPDAQPEYRGPRGFRWVMPGRLGTAPLPGVVLDMDLDLAALRQVGVTTLITLTKGDLPQDALLRHGLRNLHLPIYDREAPSINQLRMLAIRMSRLLAQDEVLCVHCRAGLGRTGTVVAGWMIHEGLTAEAALERLRAIDRSYVQSEEQEAFLHELETSFLMKI